MNEQNPTEKETENSSVHPYRRQRLEPEIAALSVEKDEGENPAVVVNIEDPAAKKAIKRVIVWLGIGGFLEWARRSAHRQVAAAMAGTATVATVATVAVTEVIRDEPPNRNPGVTAERVVTLPPDPAITVTVSTTPTQARSTRSPRSPWPSASTPAPTSAPTAAVVPATAQPTRTGSRPTPRPTRTRATTRPATRPPTRTPDLAATRGRATTPATPPAAVADPSPAPQPEESGPTPEPPAQTPVPDPGPTLAAAECDGLVQVDLNPLLDLCVLG